MDTRLVTLGGLLLVVSGLTFLWGGALTMETPLYLVVAASVVASSWAMGEHRRDDPA